MHYGMLHLQSSKQNMKAKSSTEAELIGTIEYVPFNVWMFMFLESQGYEIKKNIIFQDNQSTIRMANNRRDSYTGNSRHINIHHFFVKDRFNKGEIEAKYCPTHLMIAEYFTKPMQGNIFKMFRYLIIEYVHINNLLQAIELSAKESIDK